MENKLIPLSDFVLKTVHTPNVNEAICWEQTEERLQKIYKYTQFLKQSLALWMLVPCDEDGNVLEQPCDIMNTDGCRDCACREFKKAKSRVLFEGFEYMYSFENYWIFKHKDNFEMFVPMNSIIEKLIQENIEIILTETVIKSIYEQ
ncbi:hypothetical protein OZ664_11800 [Elizabethkingia sp. HX WHF]|uniref:hypothetical protein n=1 Tax=Elizabethkingia sp. HX WHF TaxID=3003190 RepID=UPI002A24F28F|nr:hypothetical protein [Elizabethkingia sp. HX WHF]MDX8564684.1 hypothetical protein [Elizabethkingia sp. HX WHF]